MPATRWRARRARRAEPDPLPLRVSAPERGKPSGMPAGKAVLIVVIALAFALLFDSAAVVHSALGMRPGPVRTAVLSVARPVDWLAQHIWLDRPKKALDEFLGNGPVGQHSLADGAQTVPGLTSTASARPSARREPAIVSPTTSDPLRVLVLGDSLAPYLGGQLAELASNRGLIRVSREWHDGTGIANSEYFDWRDAAVLAARSRRAQAVVFALGVGDSQDMFNQGRTLAAGTDEWRDEYARRVALIMQALVDSGVQRIYWHAPPSAPSGEVEVAFSAADRAISMAAQAVAGGRNLDPRGPQQAAYSDAEVVDGRMRRTRQADGIRWTYTGARRPAQVVLRALLADYGDIG